MTTLKFRSAMICILPFITMYVRAMEDSANSNDMYSMVTRGVGALFTGLDKTVRGHAPRFEGQLQSNTLSTNSKTNSHELDWALDQLIAAKGSGALVEPDRIVNMLALVQLQVDKNPKILQVSEAAQKQSLAYLERYTKAMDEQLLRVATLKAFLESKKKTIHAVEQSLASNASLTSQIKSKQKKTTKSKHTLTKKTIKFKHTLTAKSNDDDDDNEDDNGAQDDDDDGVVVIPMTSTSPALSATHSSTSSIPMISLTTTTTTASASSSASSNNNNNGNGGGSQKKKKEDQ